MGSYYLAQMLNRFDVPINAVCAYNAGPTRMRGWRSEYAGLPQDLLLEAIPIEETQNHGRKVFFSAVLYGYLYYGVSPDEVAEYYFQFPNRG
jgi:soluble lytic murein transglycosylase